MHIYGRLNLDWFTVVVREPDPEFVGVLHGELNVGGHLYETIGVLVGVVRQCTGVKLLGVLIGDGTCGLGRRVEEDQLGTGEVAPWDVYRILIFKSSF